MAENLQEGAAQPWLEARGWRRFIAPAAYVYWDGKDTAVYGYVKAVEIEMNKEVKKGKKS